MSFFLLLLLCVHGVNVVALPHVYGAGIACVWRDDVGLPFFIFKVRKIVFRDF